MNDSTLSALDLCCGAGGLSRGFQAAGFRVHGVDKDADALDTHARHVGPCEAGDLRTYHPARRSDAVIGGPPCQPFSIAGKGLADADDRYLIPDFLRIAREAHARAILIENVRGLVTRHPRTFRAVLDACEAEYLTTWTVVNASHYGVPQNRERLFIVGFRDAADRARFKWPAPTHAPPGELFGAPHRTVREALDLGPAPHRAGRREGASGWQGQRLLDVDAPAFTVGTRNNADLLDRPAPVIKGRKQPMKRRRRASERLSEVRERRLSAEECAILQGFPPGWTWTGTIESQHRQIGNAVPPALAEAMARAIRAALTPSRA